MPDSLKDKAKEVITNDANIKALKYVKKELKEQNANVTKKELDFYIEFMMTGKAYSSYKKVFDENMSRATAAVLANRLLKKVRISFVDYLDFAGHGPDKIAEALDKLFEKDPDKYLTHITKLKQLDVQKIQHSGSIEIPVINIISERKD